MKIKFKDGIIIEVTETEGKKSKEILAEAKEIHDDFVKDAKLRKTFYTNVAFSLNNIKEAIEGKNWNKLNKELSLLNRDIDTDLARNDNYTEKYSYDQLKKVIKAYQDVVALLRNITDENASSAYSVKADEIDEKINHLKNHWNINDSKSVKDADPETIAKLIKEEEDAVKSYGNAIQIAREANDEAAVARYQHILDEEMEHIQELKDLLSNDIHDSKSVNDVPPYYDPSVTVGETETNYSISRIEKADRYNDITILNVEFDGIIQDLEEYIQDMTDFNDPDNVVHKYRKDELRQITSKYYELANIYKKNGLADKADSIKALTDTLYQKWHLGA